MSWESSYYAEHDLLADCGRCGDRGLVDECACLQMCDCAPTACPDCGATSVDKAAGDSYVVQDHFSLPSNK